MCRVRGMLLGCSLWGTHFHTQQPGIESRPGRCLSPVSEQEDLSNSRIFNSHLATRMSGDLQPTQNWKVHTFLSGLIIIIIKRDPKTE